MKWYLRVLLRPMVSFIKQVVSRLIIEGSNHLIEGQFSERMASKLNIADAQVDAIIAEFAEGLVQFTENNLDAIVERLLNAPKVKEAE